MAVLESPPGALLESFRNAIVAFAEISGNRLLAHDDIALAACAELRGHCIAIEFTDLAFTLYCHPGEYGIRLSSSPPAREVDARIAGRLAAFASLAADDDKLSTSIRENVAFSGKVALAQRLHKILADLDIDWEGLLAGYTGDLAAVQITRGLATLWDRINSGVESILANSSDYLREEIRVTPTQAEFDGWRDQVGELRHGVARAEARLERLFAALRER